MQLRPRTTEIGKIARISYFAADTGYTVLRLERDDFSEFTAVGTMPDAKEGVTIELMGEWKQHPKFGDQFAFVAYDVPAPTEEVGMIAYLSSLKGIGESLAQRIIAHFGLDQVLEVLEFDSDRLLEVPGVGQKTLPRIVESFHESKGIRTLISFLATVGISASYAPRIYKEYGAAAIAEIKKNPYILAEEVRGFGFTRADEVARKLGIASNSVVRAIAGIAHCLRTAALQQGHCYLRVDELVDQAANALALPGFRFEKTDIELTINRMHTQRQVVADGDRVYLYSYHQAETQLAELIQILAGTFNAKADLTDWMAQYEADNGLKLSKGQKDAIVAANHHGLTVMTGGAGVGKTAAAKAVIESWHERGLRVVACAPTGKAAQRIREVTGLPTASTIHRLLGWNGTGFNHNQDAPIEADAFLIDEFSMTDLKLANALFQAIPYHAIVLVVGDVNQLPSIGAGNVLRDLIESQEVPVIRLTETFRQSATSRIIQASLAINEGKFPILEQIARGSGKPQSDALWVKCSSDRIPVAIHWLLTEKLLEMGWYSPDIQVLSPMNKGDIGNFALNQQIQQIWTPLRRGEPVMGQFREGDRVIQTRNDYNKNVFNGDIGLIIGIDLEENELYVLFEDLDTPGGRTVIYESSDLENLMLAYSISIHRSQGSEFPVVVIPCSMSHSIMLARNLYYTGVTRGKKLVVLVGEEQAIQTAVRTQRLSQRNTALAARIRNQLTSA